MKRVLMILLVLGLLLMAGCAKEAADTDVPSKPVDAKQIAQKPLPGEAGSGISESDMGDIDTLEEDLDTSDLDSLDEDLNFEI